jgi:hypothetical protein
MDPAIKVASAVVPFDVLLMRSGQTSVSASENLIVETPN